MKDPKWFLLNVFLFGVFTWECAMISRGRWFRPTAERLEARAVLSGTTDGIMLETGDMGPEMPNGVEAFAPEAPFSVDFYGLIPDIDGNMPGSDNYLTGKPPEIPADAPSQE